MPEAVILQRMLLLLLLLQEPNHVHAQLMVLSMDMDGKSTYTLEFYFRNLSVYKHNYVRYL